MRTSSALKSWQFRGARFPKRKTRRTRKPRQVSLRTLTRLVRTGQCVRTGVTQNPTNRFAQYKGQKKYKNTEMLYSPTRNAMRTEDKLLSFGTCKFNVQRLSNAQQEPSNAYVLKRKPGNKARRAVAGRLTEMIHFFLSPWRMPFWW